MLSGTISIKRLRRTCRAPRRQQRAATALDTSREEPCLWQVEARQGLLRQQLDRVALEGLLHRLHDAVDLGDPKERQALELLRPAVPLGHTPGDHHRLAQLPAPLDEAVHGGLSRVFDRAGVDNPAVGRVGGRIPDEPISVRLQLPHHVLRVRAADGIIACLRPGHQCRADSAPCLL